MEAALANNNTNDTLQLLAQKDAEIAQLKADNAFLHHELEKIKRMLFGSKSERFISETPGQLTLGFEVDTPIEEKADGETITYQRKKPVEKKEAIHSRQPLPSHLPREEVIIEPENLEEGAKKIGEEITEVLEYKPGRLFVRRYVRPKYVLSREDNPIIIAELPSLPIPKGNAGASLISHITISKFVDHLPFYRQVQMFSRNGITIPESTINDWFKGGCEALVPLYEELIKQIQNKKYLMADETPIPVLDKDHPGFHPSGVSLGILFATGQIGMFRLSTRKGKGWPKKNPGKL
jgi:transposase